MIDVKIVYKASVNNAINLTTAILLVEGFCEGDPENERAADYLQYLKDQQVEQTRQKLRVVKEDSFANFNFEV